MSASPFETILLHVEASEAGLIAARYAIALAKAYGARLREELSAQAGREATVSSIYITLTRLETKGMVRSWMGEPTQVRGGKARRFFQVEARGLAALNQARDRLLAMWEGVQTASEGSGG